MSFIMAISSGDVEPEIDLSDEYIRRRFAQTSTNESEIPSTVRDANAMSCCQVLPKQINVDEQAECSETLLGVEYFGIPSLVSYPHLKRFVDEFNPFAPLVIHTLSTYYDPFGSQMGTGSEGRQGFRLGWSSYNEVVVLPASRAFGTMGNLKFVEWNSNMKFSHVIRPGVLLNGTAWFNAEWWDGPQGVNLPGQVDQVSLDLELGLYHDGPWSGQVAIHPQLVETYEGPLDRNAFTLDGRAVATYKASSALSFVFGAAVWDRADIMIVPHVGVIWTDEHVWEIRALFPKSRVSYFLGRWGDADSWLYGQCEYTAEAWQAYLTHPSSSERVQITDNRLSVGIRRDRDRYSCFGEVGYVLNRHVTFAGSPPPFSLAETVMVRLGIRY